MFSWFSPRCPVSTWEKTWTETRMCWFAEKLGLDRLLQAEVLLPNEDFFLEPYQGSTADAQRMMDQLCRHLGIDPDAVQFVVSSEERPSQGSGHDETGTRGDKALIRIAAEQLDDPEILAATLAHELAHELLTGGGLLDAPVFDQEWIFDLLPVYLGAGLFAANATIREQCGLEGAVSWWTMRRHGYLPSRMFGYAMALFAYMRGENDPSWAGYLRADAASALRAGLRYLGKTKDSLFHPDTVRSKRPGLNAAQAVDWLKSETASLRLAVLWQIQEIGLRDVNCLEGVMHCLRDSDADVAAEAARTLGIFGPVAAPAIPKLREALWASADNLRANAAHALGSLALEADVVVPDLCCLLAESSRPVNYEAAWALGRMKTQVDSMSVNRILAKLETALLACDYPMVEVVAAALLAVTRNPEQCIHEHFTYPDVRQSALAAIADQRVSLAGAEVSHD